MGTRAARLPALVALVATWLSAAPVVHAGELEDFQAARNAYEVHDYPLAITRFEELVAGTDHRLTSDALMLESRKYLGAAYVLVGRREAAASQFELLLEADDAYDLEPDDFPIEVLEVWAAARERFLEERRRADEARLAADRRAHELSVIRDLVAFAERDVEIEIENSRWIAALPFGVGQFQNGDDGLGAFFLVAEGLTVASLAGTLAGYLYVLDLAQRAPPTSVFVREEAPGLLTGLSIGNWTSIAAFGVLAIAGIVEAELTFHPTHVVRHRRVVPAELLEGVEGLDETPDDAPADDATSPGVGLSFSFGPPDASAGFAGSLTLSF